jgi:hypothetical protein
LGVELSRVNVDFVVETVSYDVRDNEGYKKLTKIRVTVKP